MTPPACGTERAYQRHRYLGQDTDPACRAAHAETSRTHRTSRSLYAISRADARSEARRVAMARLGAAHPERLAELRAALEPQVGAWWRTLRPARAALAREHPDEFGALLAEETAKRGDC